MKNRKTVKSTIRIWYSQPKHDSATRMESMQQGSWMGSHLNGGHVVFHLGRWVGRVVGVWLDIRRDKILQSTSQQQRGDSHWPNSLSQ